MKKSFLSIILTSVAQVVLAGGGQRVPPTPIRGIGPPPGLPIDQYLLVLFFIGIGVVLYFTHRKKTSVV